ncbi:nuclear transport factor 2 family protein [Sphaerisporangium album]|uniref:Nuclear transport factor 2 family protein n=1 Tax=Sphaerisporangium album TaxID=509200 RepID=A0A367EV35_9ACTN|nr:nuclear transport factor 2 family protein [Sphaerisporangium album]RCG21913.1 nuclear transport factor 2 family protein [Sphaerisporangium album]
MPANQFALDAETAEFARQWFDRLSAHEPVERLLPLVVDRDLEMAFPERTLRSHDDFRDWYAVVGESFTDQTHVVERLDARDDGDTVHVDVQVVWTATSTSDGSRSSFRVTQVWELAKTPDGLAIVKYYVGALNPLSPAEK